MREREQCHAIVAPQCAEQPVARIHEMPQPFAGDALAGVERQQHAERQRIERHAVDLLRHAIVREREVSSGQPGDRLPATCDGDVELDDLDANPETAAVPARVR